MTSTDKYKFCNHHHKLTDDQKIIDLGTGKFVADKPMIPLLKALNDLGLVTCTHNYNEKGAHFIGIILDNAEIRINKRFERNASRTKFNGKKHITIWWKQ